MTPGRSSTTLRIIGPPQIQLLKKSVSKKGEAHRLRLDPTTYQLNGCKVERQEEGRAFKGQTLALDLASSKMAMLATSTDHPAPPERPGRTITPTAEGWPGQFQKTPSTVFLCAEITIQGPAADLAAGA